MEYPPNILRAMQAANHYSKIKPQLRPNQFLCIDLKTSELLYSIRAGDGWVHVIGNPDHGSYEWVYADDRNGLVKASDDGWGGPDCAMREGLRFATE